ncbi:hypothetical protein HY642_01295 [Candidatus Woesearchaeota archaeon]|nr:hypothetical protein [Candidatus Woesearchaeota archaeon]
MHAATMDERLTLKTKEFVKLEHRLVRYKKFLMNAALRVREEMGLNLIICNRTDHAPQQGVIYVREMPREECEAKYGVLRDDAADYTNLLALARDAYPSLYRRYVEGERKYFQAGHQMDELIAAVRLSQSR